LARRLDVRLHTHLAETEDENRYCLELHRCRPLDYLEECGWLNGRTWLAHGVHFNPDEFKRLVSAGTAVTHCACSNQVLASGTCPVCALEEAGVAVGLGVDGSLDRGEWANSRPRRGRPDAAACGGGAEIAGLRKSRAALAPSTSKRNIECRCCSVSPISWNIAPT
jgi:Amidohydrolase family